MGRASGLAPADTPVVIYAAKSSEDTRGSIATQLEDCRAATAGRTVVAEFSDEAASAYKGNRGPGLQEAKDAAVQAALGGSAELWVQHSDRLARGDGLGADHLAEVFFAMRRANVRLRSVQDDANLEDAIRAVLIGERNHEDSKRKSAAVRSGLKRRADAGLAVGAIPYGYRAEATIENGQAVTRRTAAERSSAVVERIFDLVEAGRTFGDVCRALNADGLRALRGGQWTTRAVRRIVLNEDYTGSTGYPQLIDPERHARIVASVKRLDPVAVQARQGGRKGSEDYMLRGVAFCGYCGASLYTRRYKRIEGERAYVCAAVRESRGICTAKPIPAQWVETAVVDHLKHFLGDVEAWISARATESCTERDRFAVAVEAQRAQLKQRQVRAARAHETYERLLDDGDELAHEALRAAVRMDDEASTFHTAVESAEQRLEDWPTAPDVDAALEFYCQLNDVITGQLPATAGARELNAALRTVLEGAWLGYENDDLLGSFKLRVTDEVLAGRLPVELTIGGMDEVGWRTVIDRLVPMGSTVGETEPHTLVNGPVRPIEIPPMVVAVG